MLPSLSEIKEKRKRFGITQSELARLAGVSQSLVTKVESGKMIPSYENAKRILDVLENRELDSSVKAAEIMSRKVISVRPDATVNSAVKLMKKHAVSQLPVIDGTVAVGAFSEKTVVSKIHDGESMESIGETPISQVMEDSIPIIQENAPISIVSSLLEHNQAVLVAKGGKICGIVTKADLLNVMLLKRGKTWIFR